MANIGFEYPTDAVVHGDYSVGYISSCLRAGVSSVREQVNKQEYIDVHGYDNIPVNIEAPAEGQSYPYIHVMYKNKSFEPASIEESVFASYDHDQKFDEFMTYRFRGSYIVNIYATTILERELISDCLIGALGIDRSFHRTLVDNPYINIAPNMKTLSSPSSNESWGTPWSENVMTAFRQLSFDVLGEFYYRVAEHPVYVEAIEVKAMLDDR